MTKLQKLSLFLILLLIFLVIYLLPKGGKNETQETSMGDIRQVCYLPTTHRLNNQLCYQPKVCWLNVCHLSEGEWRTGNDARTDSGRSGQDSFQDSSDTFESTCYCETGITASGLEAGAGRVAVDPLVIPLGTNLQIDGYGFAVAADTGELIKGKMIDVFLPACSACIQWGRRQVKVKIMGD